MKIIYLAIEFDGTHEGIHRALKEIIPEIQDIFKTKANATGRINGMNYDFQISEDESATLANLSKKEMSFSESQVYLILKQNEPKWMSLFEIKDHCLGLTLMRIDIALQSLVNKGNIEKLDNKLFWRFK